MPSYQLTISPNYVPNWGISEALREIVQNGIDRENETKGESKMSIIYDPIQLQLVIGNPGTSLHKRTLLLGETTKDGKSTIGKYGEGYKLALLVLLRLGCRITILNDKEIWIPKLIKSRVFDAELIQVDVSKNHEESKHGAIGWLSYTIKGITPEHYSAFQDKCLIFHTTERISGSAGDVLLGEKFKGLVYCNSLYVCTIPELHYGYDMKPNCIQLDRDRKKVEQFNLTWETSKIWAESYEVKLVDTMIDKDAIDVAYYLTHKQTWKPHYQELCELQYQEFLKVHGVNAVVCKDEDEANLIKSRYKNLVPVIVPEKKYQFIHDSASYQATPLPKREEMTPTVWIENWLENLQTTDSITEESANNLRTEAEKWRYK